MSSATGLQVSHDVCRLKSLQNPEVNDESPNSPLRFLLFTEEDMEMLGCPSPNCRLCLTS